MPAISLCSSNLRWLEKEGLAAFPADTEFNGLIAAFEAAVADEAAAINAAYKAGDPALSPEAKAAFLSAGKYMNEAYTRKTSIYRRMLALRGVPGSVGLGPRDRR